MEEFLTKEMRMRLNRLELVSLREISTVLGITTNSKKNKSEIINDICSVCFCQANYKSDLTVNEIAELSYFEFPLTKRNFILSENELISYEKHDDFGESLVRASSTVVEYKIVDKDGKEKKSGDLSEFKRREREVVKYTGFIEDIEDELRIVTINSDEVYDISSEDRAKWDLEKYDTISFNRYWSVDEGRYLANIYSVNGRKTGEKSVRTNIDVLNNLKPSKEFDFTQDNNICTLLSTIYPIKFGERILISTSENNGKKRIANEIVKTLKNKCDMMFAIHSNQLTGMSVILEEVDKNATFIGDDISPLLAINKTSIAFMRAKKFVEEGKNVVVVMGGLDDYCDHLFELTGESSTQHICKYVDSLFRSSGVYENGGSMTIICVVGTDELLNERLKSRFNFFAPLKDADMSLYPQVDFKNIKINPRRNFDE